MVCLALGGLSNGRLKHFQESGGLLSRQQEIYSLSASLVVDFYDDVFAMFANVNGFRMRRNVRRTISDVYVEAHGLVPMEEGFSQATQFRNISFRMLEYRNALPVVKPDELFLLLRPIQIRSNLIQNGWLHFLDEIGLHKSGVGSDCPAHVSANGSWSSVVARGDDVSE